MESNGIQNAFGALNIPDGQFRAAQAIYKSISSNRQEVAGNDSKGNGSTAAYTVSISSRGQQLAKADFRREQQKEAADFNRKEQLDAANFNREQMRAKAEFQRQERQKEADFNQSQRQDAALFERQQRQKEAGFQRQLSRNTSQAINKQEP